MTTSLIGQHPVMHQLRQRLAQYANLDFPVLIDGESGCGKEIAASQHLHRMSKRCDMPFLALNCAALTAPLLESILFGHCKGAFTGATQDHSGYFQDAADGTLFLDEIGELPPELQSKLLRVLESGEYQRLGETRTRHSTARIIAATNRNLHREVREGRFRADLYHRLSVFTVTLPPLRERGNDRRLLLDHFASAIAQKNRCPPFVLDAKALEHWDRYGFPGNVRELRNITIRLTAHHSGKTVSEKDLIAELTPESTGKSSQPIQDPHDAEQIKLCARQTLLKNQGIDLDSFLSLLERSYIEAAIELTNGNISRAARRLSLKRSTLYHRMQICELRP
jgi:two-component system nitrogen regulation response regulator GlnG